MEFFGWGYSEDLACHQAIDWLEMQALILRVDGQRGNAAMARRIAKLISDLHAKAKK